MAIDKAADEMNIELAIIGTGNKRFNAVNWFGIVIFGLFFGLAVVELFFLSKWM